MLAIYTVSNTNDSGLGSLRQAIIDANATVGVADTIAFNVAPGGPTTIKPLSALPIITDPVVVDGTTQPGFVGMPIVELDGSQAGNAVGLRISGGASEVRGLVINRFGSHGIQLTNAGGNTIQGNYIGVDSNAAISLGNSGDGLAIQCSLNTVGGTLSSQTNVISGNRNGVSMTTVAATGNSIQGNLLGTDKTGTLAIPNQNGVSLKSGASANTVGGLLTGSGNTLSGNSSNGIEINNAGTNANYVVGNRIGTSQDGMSRVANGQFGVTISDSASLNVIGDSVPGAGNLISGNRSGIGISGASCTDNRIQGNVVGLDVSGTSIIANSESGISCDAVRTQIGGLTADSRNVVSGNIGRGIVISSHGSFNVIQGNYIGTDITGMIDLGNLQEGIYISGGASNQIGGTEAGAGNLISGNRDGIAISGSTSTRNQIAGNLIGLNATGDIAIPNTDSGVRVFAASGNTIGGTIAGARNVISGNSGRGILLFGGASSNVVQGNYIGTDITGMIDLGNLQEGIYISGGASNQIGSTEAGAGNLISGNDNGGVVIAGTGTTNSLNVIVGNYIGTDVSGSLPVPNSRGVYIDGDNNQVGGTQPNSANRIAFNTTKGVIVYRGLGNTVRGNEIFGNGGLGIDLGNNGVTANDTLDSDSGANGLQNFPVLAKAISSESNIAVSGTLNANPSSSYRLEYFRSQSADPSGYGEGQEYLGSIYVSTDIAGIAAFQAEFPASLSPGQKVTATATDTQGNTSEFSLALTLSAAPTVNLQVTGGH